MSVNDSKVSAWLDNNLAKYSSFLFNNSSKSSLSTAVDKAGTRGVAMTFVTLTIFWTVFAAFKSFPLFFIARTDDDEADKEAAVTAPVDFVSLRPNGKVVDVDIVSTFDFICGVFVTFVCLFWLTDGSFFALSMRAERDIRSPWDGSGVEKTDGGVDIVESFGGWGREAWLPDGNIDDEDDDAIDCFAGVVFDFTTAGEEWFGIGSK
jgi:hypothetical protein